MLFPTREKAGTNVGGFHTADGFPGKVEFPLTHETESLSSLTFDEGVLDENHNICLLYTSPSPRDA